jgi:transposase-like protein
MNIGSIFPNGVEKGRNKTNANKTATPELKAQAMEMLSRGIKIFMISKKLNVDKSTVLAWKKQKAANND